MSAKRTKFDSEFSLVKEEISYSDKIIGRGYYSIIYLGTFKNQPVAVKRIETDSINDDNEERILKELNHPNIITFFWAENQCQDKFRCSALELCVASMDKLFLPDDFEEKYRGPRPSELDGLLHMTEGLAYLHGIHLTHRNIKPHHILISLSNNNVPVMKLADFGLAEKFSPESGSYFVKDVRCTKDWAAPEILKLIHEQSIQNKGSGIDLVEGTIKSDVFSAGLVFFYWLTEGIHPFGESFLIMVNIFHNRPVNLERLSHHYTYEMITKKMMNPIPEARSDMDEIRNLTYLIHHRKAAADEMNLRNYGV